MTRWSTELPSRLLVAAAPALAVRFRRSLSSGSPRDLPDVANHLLDHRGGDIEMGAGADASVHDGDQHAALAQLSDHLVGGDAGAVGCEEHEIGLGLLHRDAVDLRQAARQPPGICMIVGEAVDVMVQSMDARSRADARL